MHNIVAPLFPYERHAIVRDKSIAWGHWRLRKSGVALVWIAGRVRAGEPLREVAEDYGISVDAARYAMRWLQARALRRAFLAAERKRRRR